MTSSRIPAVVDALLSVLGAALPGIEVRDGAPLQLEDEPSSLYVGADEDGSEFLWEQDWAGMSHAYRDEEFTVPCLLWVRTGDNNVKAVRDQLFGLFATVEATLRADTQLGLDPTWNVRADVAPRSYSQPQVPDGVVCKARFGIRVFARI